MTSLDSATVGKTMRDSGADFSFTRNGTSVSGCFDGEAMPHNAHDKTQAMNTGGLSQRILAALGMAPINFSEGELPESGMLRREN